MLMLVACTSQLVYLGVFLDDASQAAIKASFGTAFESVSCDHITCAFRPSHELLRAQLPFLGQEFLFSVTGYARNDRVEVGAPAVGAVCVFQPVIACPALRRLLLSESKTRQSSPLRTS